MGADLKTPVPSKRQCDCESHGCQGDTSLSPLLSLGCTNVLCPRWTNTYLTLRSTNGSIITLSVSVITFPQQAHVLCLSASDTIVSIVVLIKPHAAALTLPQHVAPWVIVHFV